MQIQKHKIDSVIFEIERDQTVNHNNSKKQFFSGLYYSSTTNNNLSVVLIKNFLEMNFHRKYFLRLYFIIMISIQFLLKYRTLLSYNVHFYVCQ